MASDGTVDLSSWADIIASGRKASTWIVWLLLVLRADELRSLTSFSVVTLLNRTFKPKLLSLHNQLVWQLASAIEKTVTLVIKNGDDRKFGLHIAPVNLKTMFTVPNYLNAYLLRAVLSYKAYSLKHTTTGICVDKANVNGVNIQQGIITYPDNALAVAPPQVLQLPRHSTYHRLAPLYYVKFLHRGPA